MSGAEDKLGPRKPLFLNPGLGLLFCPFQHQSDACRLAVPVLFLFSLSVTSQTWPGASGRLPALTFPWQALLFHCCLWPRRTFEFTGFRIEQNYVRKKNKRNWFPDDFFRSFSALGVILAVFLQLVSGYRPPEDANISSASSFLFSVFVGGAGAFFTHISLFEASVVSFVGLT